MDRYFQAQTSYPLGDILAVRNYALAIIRQSSSEGHTVTRHGPNELSYQGIRLSSLELGDFLRSYTIDTSKVLIDLLFGFPNWERITRDLNIAEIGRREDWSRNATDFGLSDPSSPFFDFLGLHAFGPGASEWLLRSNALGTPEINRGTAMTYLNKVESFLTDLLVLCHITSGAPARGTEISQVLRASSAITGRNLFLDPQRGLFLIRLTYSKTFSTSNIEQNAVRVVPPALSYLLLVYLVIVLPFRVFLCEMLSIGLRAELLFGVSDGTAISSRTLKDRLALRTQTILGHRIGLKSWRHLAQGFIRYGMQETLAFEDAIEDDLGTDEAIGASQMHHSVRTGQLIYGRTEGQLTHLTKDLQDIYIDFCHRWHQYIGVGSQFDLFWHLYPSITPPSFLPTMPSTALGPDTPSQTGKSSLPILAIFLLILYYSSFGLTA
jgi:hypothetical protein